MHYFRKSQVLLKQIKRKFSQWHEAFWWFRKDWLSRRNPIVSYAYQLLDLIIEALFLLLATWAISCILLHVVDLFWKLYLETMMGQEFCLFFPNRAEMIEQTLNNDLIPLSGKITFAAFLVSLAIAALGQITHFNRHFYLSMGLIGKLLYWGLPLSAIIAFYIHKQYLNYLNWEMTFALAAIPTYCLFMNTFKYATKLVPEMEDLFYWGNFYGSRVWRSLKRLIHNITQR